MERHPEHSPLVIQDGAQDDTDGDGWIDVDKIYLIDEKSYFWEKADSLGNGEDIMDMAAVNAIQQQTLSDGAKSSVRFSSR
ncbi:hypothetical protein NCS52_00346900 [Fusarium sp. LHS14.1]|nr:hypothetical protein NCS52_00346900 [Fusarium sp. LHS14.1]